MRGERVVRKPGRPNVKTLQALQWFKENGEEQTLHACATALGLSLAPVRAAREMLKNGQMLDPDFASPVAGRRALSAAPLDPPSTSAAYPPARSVPAVPATILDPNTVKHMDRDEARRVLAGLARGGANSDAAQIAALKTVINEGEDTGSHLGPGMPLTREDRLHRASLIMQAVGRTDAPDVWRRAFHETVDATTRLPEPPIVDDIPSTNLPSIQTEPLPGATDLTVDVGQVTSVGGQSESNAV